MFGSWKLDKSLQIEGEKKIKRLKENPREIGRSLKYFRNLYELYVRMYRIFYVIEDYKVRVLLLSVEHKDETDKYLRNLTTQRIKQLLEENS